MDVGGSRNEVSLPEGAQCGGPLGTPKDMSGFLFLEPEDIKNVSLGIIWNFGNRAPMN
jgi:hypothetical protein